MKLLNAQLGTEMVGTSDFCEISSKIDDINSKLDRLSSDLSAISQNVTEGFSNVKTSFEKEDVKIDGISSDTLKLQLSVDSISDRLGYADSLLTRILYG